MPRAKKPSNLAAALANAQKTAVLTLIEENPLITVAELASIPGEIGELAATLTMAEIKGLKVPKSARRVRRSKGVASAGSEVDTQTKQGREAYTSSVLRAVKSAGEKVGAEALRAEVGGTAEQLRKALARLTKARKIKRTGKARGTAYQAK